jgi:NAD(P)H-dependent FMN reductase
MEIAVILGSIREIRRGGRVAKWLMPQLSKRKDINVELLDLKDYPLPFYNESDSPEGLEDNYSNELAKKWVAKIREKDAFILITPEYNHGTSAVLKNALDWVYYEWNKKPVAFVSYSPNAAGGIRAVEQLRQTTIELQMAPMHNAIHINYVLDTIDEDGNLLKGHFNERLVKLLDELLWWAEALKTAREKNLE